MPETVTITIADIWTVTQWERICSVLRKPEMAAAKPWRRRLLAELADQISAQVDPTPEEPTGLGAVIADRSGNHWIRQPHLTHLPWTSVETPALWHDYSEIDVAEVLFVGVTSL